MKNLKNLIIAFVAITFLLQSCSSGHMFSKKRYGHLNWIEHDSKVETNGNGKPEEPVRPKTIVADERALNDAGISNKNNAKTEVSGEINTTINKVPVSFISTEKTSEHQKQVISADNIYDENTTTSFEKKETRPTITPSIKPEVKKPMIDETAKLVICVILAIIIPPLGMYVWDQNTDSWFVIDLILFLCWAFWFFLGPLGLLALGSIVIAILRVFGLL